MDYEDLNFLNKNFLNSHDREGMSDIQEVGGNKPEKEGLVYLWVHHQDLESGIIHIWFKF